MKKVIGIFNFLFGNASGAQSLARTHVEVLRKAYGVENVIVYALVGQEKVEDRKDLLVRGVSSNFCSRLINLLKGNTGKVNQIIIDDIMQTIEVKKVDIIYIDDSIYGNVIKQIKSRYPHIKIIVFYHDIKRYLALEWAKKNPKSVPIQISLITNERKSAKYADVNIVLNNREEELFEKFYHKKPEMQLPIILPCPVSDKVSDKVDYEKKTLQILFVGGYYYPNVNGFRWFVNNVAPMIKKKYQIILVGNKMESLKKEFSNNNNVVIIGRVEDLSPYYTQANLVIGPIFEGAGMKVKTAEAFSYGKYFVGTTESLVGYQDKAGKLMGKSIFLCDTKEEFSNVINTYDFSNKFNNNNFSFFIENYSIEAAVKKMKKIFEF